MVKYGAQITKPEPEGMGGRLDPVSTMSLQEISPILLLLSFVDTSSFLETL